MRRVTALIDRRVVQAGLATSGIYCELSQPLSDRLDVMLHLIEKSSEALDIFRITTYRRHPLIKALMDYVRETCVKSPRKLMPQPIKLIRKALRRGYLPPENGPADLARVAILEYLIPMAVLDADSVRDPLMIRSAVRGERFLDAGGREVVLEGGEAVISDRGNNLLYLIPYGEGLGFKAAPKTMKVVLLAFSIKGVPKALMAKTLRSVERDLLRFDPYAYCNNVEITY